AKNIGNAFVREFHFFRRARFIQTKIESFSVEQRKNVVKERGGVRKEDLAAHRYNQKVRRKHAILLHQRVMTVWKKGQGSRICHRIQPHRDRWSMLLR